LIWTYDGFGNRLAQNVTKGTAPVVSLSINASTNRIMSGGFAYDAAGNLVQWPGGTVTMGAEYDVDGRLTRVTHDGWVAMRYYYDARNRRVKRGGEGWAAGLELYGLGGELLGVYGPSTSWPVLLEERVYFAGRLVEHYNRDSYYWQSPTRDRLGSRPVARRYPFGEGNNADNDEFATYRKDTTAQHYYAWHRFYSTTWGRFSSPDPYVLSGGLTNPQGWNRYSYVENDPVNFTDASGLQRDICGDDEMQNDPNCIYKRGGSGRWGIGMGSYWNGEYWSNFWAPIWIPDPSRGGSSVGAEPTPEEEARGYLRAAINMIKQAVDTIVECAELFKGGAVNAKELLDGLADGSVGVIQFGSWLGADAYTQGRTGTEVRFKDGTTLYERVDIIVNSSRAGTKYWNQVGEVGRARILLHELGHVANLSIRGKGSLFEDNDGEDMEAQKRNQALEERCFKK
jgi:RHS repeat-associated protein